MKFWSILTQIKICDNKKVDIFLLEIWKLCFSFFKNLLSFTSKAASTLINTRSSNALLSYKIISTNSCMSFAIAISHSIYVSQILRESACWLVFLLLIWSASQPAIWPAATINPSGMQYLFMYTCSSCTPQMENKAQLRENSPSN